MPITLTNALTAIMDHMKRVSDTMCTSGGVAYTWHFDILQGKKQTHYLIEHSVVDNGRTSIIWQVKEVPLLAWTSSIPGTCSFQIGEESQSKRWKQFHSGQD